MRIPGIQMTADIPTDPDRTFAEIRVGLARELARGFRGMLPVLAADLEAAAGRAESDGARQALLAASAVMRVEAEDRIARVAPLFDGAVERLVEAARIDDPTARARALSLMDQAALEIQLIAQPLAKAAIEMSGAGYATYADRVRRISPVSWSDEALNPLGMAVLAQALVAALDDALAESSVRRQLRRGLPRRAAAILARSVGGADRRLDRLGIVPLPAADIVSAVAPPLPGTEPDRAPARTGPAMDAPEGSPSAEAARRSAEPSGEKPAARAIERIALAEQDARRLGTSALASLQADERLRVLPILQPVAEIERDAVAFAHSIGEIPYSRGSRARYFANVRDRLGEGGATPAQLAVVDVVAAMFDYVVDDRRLPQAAHPLVWRLQQPSLALALLDPGYLGDEPRSLRRLVENFGAIANAFAEDLARGSELYRRMETVVRAVEIVTSALQTRSAIMSDQVAREYQRTAGHVGQLVERIVRERSALEATPGRRNRRDYTRRPNRAQEREVTDRLAQLLDERLTRADVPDSVHEFLHKVWLRHLRTAVLRDGEDSGEFRVALQVVDDLLWTLDDQAQGRPSRRELAQRIPPLIQVLTQGVREIGAKEDEHRDFFDELFLIHLRRLQRQERVPTLAEATAGVPVLDGERLTLPESSPTQAARTDGAPTGRANRSHTTIYDVHGSVPTLRDPLHARERASDREADNGASTRERTGTPGARTATGSRPGPAGAEPVERPAADPSPAPEPSIAPEGASEDGKGEGRSHRLLELLDTVDLTDLPGQPRRQLLEPDEAFGRIARGDWIEMESRDGAQRYMKIAWINRKRTVALLVRHPDRRALSLRMHEMARRFEAGRAFLLES